MTTASDKAYAPRYQVIALFGRYRVIDRWDGSKILPANWKTRQAAERWADRRRARDAQEKR